MNDERDRGAGTDPTVPRDPDTVRDDLAVAPTVRSDDAHRRPAPAQRLFDDVKRALFDGVPNAADEEPGRILSGRYRLIAFLGEGGMGRVWRAHDLVLEEEVAIKFLPRRLAERAGHLERFVREVRIARQVSHPNVCRVHDISTSDGQPFLSMEYIDGEELGALLRRIGRLGREKAIELAHELCAGLGALHERGILHRDLKPSNVMIDGRGRARITDFGLAALGHELSADEVRDGTPAYQAPEQADGREVSVRSDIFALGVLLFEMFSGMRWIDVPGRAIERTIEAENVLRPIDPGVATVVRACLDPDPDQRPGSVLAVAASLPGGDPLAAAIAAGRLPSPEAVANARTVGGLSGPIAVLALVSTFVLLAVFAAVRTRVTVLDDGVLPPDVLVHQGRELLRTLEHDGPFESDARFVEIDSPIVVAALASDDNDPRGSIERLRAYPSAPVKITYRGFANMGAPRGRWLSATDPEPRSGDARVTLDAEGRLLQLLIMPAAEIEPPTDPPARADFDALLAAVAVDADSLTPAATRIRPEVFADEHVAFAATVAGWPVHVEAAALRGRPVWLDVDRQLAKTDDPEAAAEAGDTGSAGKLAGLTVFAAIGVMLLTALVKIVRTLKRPDGDAVGARRLGYTVVGVLLLARLLDAQSVVEVFNPPYWAFAITAGFAMWLVYLMIEPFARQRLPRSLIAWNRLLQGRWSDPMVGRDVLVGSCGGMAMALVGPTWQAASGKGFAHFNPNTLLGARFSASVVLESTLDGAVLAMTLYLVLSIAEAIFRRRRIALAVIFGVTGLFTFLVALQAPWAAVIIVPFVLLFTLYVFRFGLLATTVLCAVASLVQKFPNATGGTWWLPIAFVPLCITAGLALFGYVRATAPSRVPTRVSSRTAPA